MNRVTAIHFQGFTRIASQRLGRSFLPGHSLSLLSPRSKAFSAVAAVDLYSRCVEEGILRHDPRQEWLAGRLSKLQAQLRVYSDDIQRYRELVKQRDEQRAADQNVQSKDKSPITVRTSETLKEEQEEIPKPKVPRGLYIHGNVGVGKTVLMDMFFETTDISLKRRMHFHEFMIETHSRIHQWKQERLRVKGRDLHVDLSPEADAITMVARAIASESVLLAFDEFVVTDTADALILRHLFSELFAQGTVVVATSNTAPSMLYHGGLNRSYFSSLYQYIRNPLPACRYGNDPRLSYGYHAGCSLVSVLYYVNEMTMKVKRAHARTCLFNFDEICGKQAYVGPADFQAICNNFDTIIVENVPRLQGSNHNEARRFVTFIDQVYDKRRKLYLLAEPSLEELCSRNAEDGVDDEENELLSIKELNMALKRMRSRLMEMQDDAWPTS